MEEIKVYDSNNQQITMLVQWDLNIYLYIKEDTIKEPYNVHFFNSEDDTAFVVTSTYSKGVLCAKIPNRLLYVALPITGYIYVTDDNYTYRNTYVFYLPVRSRAMPSDFVFADINDDDYFSVVKALTECKEYAESAAASAAEAENWTNLSKSWAVGDTGLRSGEDTDNSKYYAQQSASSASAASTSEKNAKTSETNAKTSETNAANSASDSADSATLSESWAVGGTKTRSGEDTDNAKYYCEQAERYSASTECDFRIMGSIPFSQLPSRSSASKGDMYNITDGFITTSDFQEGEGYVVPEGANVYLSSTGYWDLTSGAFPMREIGEATDGFLVDEKGNIITDENGDGLYGDFNVLYFRDDNVANEFEKSVSYAVGDYCVYNHLFYRFTKSRNGSWSTSYVEATTVGDELKDARTRISDLETITDDDITESDIDSIFE